MSKEKNIQESIISEHYLEQLLQLPLQTRIARFAAIADIKIWANREQVKSQKHITEMRSRSQAIIQQDLQIKQQIANSNEARRFITKYYHQYVEDIVCRFLIEVFSFQSSEASKENYYHEYVNAINSNPEFVCKLGGRITPEEVEKLPINIKSVERVCGNE